MAEIDLTREAIETFSKYQNRLFRNNVGEAWQGRWAKQENGNVLIQHPRRIVFGLAPGSGDIIGLRSLEIHPEMVGQRIAQFVSIETKTDRRSNTEQQDNWAEMVRMMGGVAGTARSIDEVATLLGVRRK